MVYWEKSNAGSIYQVRVCDEIPDILNVIFSVLSLATNRQAGGKTGNFVVHPSAIFYFQL